MEKFKVIIVEDVPLELKGTEGILKTDIPEADIIGTASNEVEFWRLLKVQLPDLVLLDLGLGGSTTVGVEICRHIKNSYAQVKVLIFTGEILNEIGQNYLALKDNEKALKSFQDASIKPYARPIYFYNIALVYKNMGDMENYNKLIKALDSMNPITTQDFVDLSGIYLDYAGKNKAIAILDKGLKLSPKNKQLLDAKVRIYNVTSDTLNENKIRQEINKVCK